MKNIFDRTREPLNHDIYQRFICHVDFEELRSSMVDSIYNQVASKLKIEFPQIDAECKKIIETMKLHLQECIETRKFMIEKTENLMQSNSLCQDVYHLKDDMIELKKILDNFKCSMKKIFQVYIDYEGDNDDDEDY